MTEASPGHDPLTPIRRPRGRRLPGPLHHGSGRWRTARPADGQQRTADPEDSADPTVGPRGTGEHTEPNGGSVVDWAYYRAGRRDPAVTDWADAVQRSHRGEGFVWIGMLEPSHEQLGQVARAFDLHTLAVEDAVVAHQRPKLDRYDDQLFCVFKTLNYLNHDPAVPSDVVETGEVMVFTGAGFSITVRHGLHNALQGVRQELEANPDHLAVGPAAVLHAVADRIVDNYLTVVHAIEDDVDALELAVFSAESVNRVKHVYQMKREVLELKRAVTPLARPLRQLAESRMPQIPEDMREYFRDVDDHLTTVTDMVASFDEMLTSIVAATLAQLSVMENEDMRRISAWVAIVAVPTMIAGVYGMNFDHMPELHTRWGYPLVMSGIAVVCLALWRWFKHKRWL